MTSPVICQGVSLVQPLTLYHFRLLNNGKSLYALKSNLVSILQVVSICIHASCVKFEDGKKGFTFPSPRSSSNTVQKMKFSIKDFFSKCDQTTLTAEFPSL